MSVPRYEIYKDSGVEWLGAVPSHWSIRRLGTMFDEVAEEGNDDLPILSVSIHDGVSDREFSPHESDRKVSRSDDRSKYKQVRPGDLVYNMMRAWQGGFGAVQVEGLVSPAYVVARPIRKFRTEFIEALLRTPSAVEEMRRHSQGVTDFRLRLYWEEFRTIKVAVPPTEEQTEILAFLGRETGKIDALVEEQKRLIALLKEKRQAVIAHAVTKGVNHNAPMKISGSKWMGEVPQHWVVLSLSRITAQKCDGPFGSGLKSEHYCENGIRVVRLQNIRGTGFDDSDTAFIDADHYRNTLGGGHEVIEGDLLIAGLGDDNHTVGRACVAPRGIEPAMVKADCFRFRLNGNVAVPEFVALQLTAGAYFDAGMLSAGSTRSRIPLSTMATRCVALPPPSEQLEIIARLGEQVSRISSMLDTAQAAIELLQERRSALISAAVTGKIDVRGLVPDQAEAA